VEPGQHPLQQGQVGTVARVGRPVDNDQVLVGHVTDQDADDAEGQVELCGDLGDGQNVVAEDRDGPLLHSQLGTQPQVGEGSVSSVESDVIVGFPVWIDDRTGG
jgi:hypothetical protein